MEKSDMNASKLMESNRVERLREKNKRQSYSRAKLKQKKILRFNRAIAASEECEPAAKRIRTDEPVGVAEITSYLKYTLVGGGL